MDREIPLKRYSDIWIKSTNKLYYRIVRVIVMGSTARITPTMKRRTFRKLPKLQMLKIVVWSKREKPVNHEKELLTLPERKTKLKNFQCFNPLTSLPVAYQLTWTATPNTSIHQLWTIQIPFSFKGNYLNSNQG